MRIEKKTLNDALRVLGKVVCQTSPVELYRSVRFVGDENRIRAMATDGVETVSVILDAFAETAIDFCVPFKELKDLVRMGRSETIELTGKFIEFPELEEPSADAISAILPVNFRELISQAASVIDRSNYRRLLQGINLSNAGVTATDGKQLLHLPCVLSLPKDVTIPFPSALLAAKTSEMGILRTWNNLFQVEIGNFKWHGKLLEGQYPNWRGVIPSAESHDYSITLHEVEKVLAWLKMISNQETTNGIELNVMPDGSVTLVSCIQPNFELNTSATVTGVRPRAVLTLDREIILRMLLQGYTTFKAHSDGLVPVIASGGAGQYIAMPIRAINKNPIPTNKENKEMEIENNVVEQQNANVPTAPVANPLDELNANVEEFRGKLKLLLDESGVLIRKVKEVALVQKQKERDFIQARRAIERIRMAI
ncbi:MAG: hypothetical protein E7053_10760 [Lentisphaerae bacterium]|nr:hypothetical protein [Lentisphaerota bacterium]